MCKFFEDIKFEAPSTECMHRLCPIILFSFLTSSQLPPLVSFLKCQQIVSKHFLHVSAICEGGNALRCCCRLQQWNVFEIQLGSRQAGLTFLPSFVFMASCSCPAPGQAQLSFVDSSGRSARRGPLPTMPYRRKIVNKEKLKNRTQYLLLL